MSNNLDLSRIVQYSELDSLAKRELIHGLLKLDPSERSSISQIKSCKLFQEVNFKLLMNEALPFESVNEILN